jgi:glycosyltransferase involved in cell wall biosynthesis
MNFFLSFVCKIFTTYSAPFFSVIIPVYNRTDELYEAILSILDQTFQNFELLIVCDGSPASTIEVVDIFQNHPQVRIFKFSSNSGNPCRGRNLAIHVAKGKYLLFLDSDDIAVPQRLEYTYHHIKQKNIDIVGGAIRYLVKEGKCRGFTDGQLGFTGEECNYELLLKGNRLSICTVAVRLSLLKKYGGFREEMRYREDHELWLRLAYHGATFYNTPEVLAYYRIHDENAELGYLEKDDYWFQKAIDLHKKPYTITTTSILFQ